jgi:hypothetical protein
MTVELRKAKRDEQLLKRRNVTVEDEGPFPLKEANQTVKRVYLEGRVVWLPTRESLVLCL